ncbi:MAG TPA: cystathionine gamma-synthase [Cryomorphaceae bacterium]|nr:cystathionine gamma-synthase [Cryomorphaceae bacterium]|tara:strand:+ start:9182 stop:10333 length:1152 start_codon:yes stop_codon:yes gene_type:complete
MEKSNNIETLAIHGGQHPDPTTGAVMPPIFQTSTYVQEYPGKHKGFEYSRSQNPTRSALQRAIASLEGGQFGAAFGSGLAAIDCLLKFLKPGDEIVACNDLYGGTYRLFTKVFSDYGLKFKFVDMSNESWADALNANTKMVWMETPTNPMLNVLDIKAVSEKSKAAGAMMVVDNTFATPYLQRPLDLGADVVMHSGTKYLGGHSDVVLGLLATANKDVAEKMYFIQNASGAILGPMDSFIALRGIKTLHVRMDRHCENAAAAAHFLDAHPAVERVYWPGLEGHNGHEVAKRQMKKFGGMVSFTVKDAGFERTAEVVSAMKVFTLAESLGGVESLAGHPASMTHASIPKEEREKVGVTDNLIRLSVGIEHVDDLLADLETALDK